MYFGSVRAVVTRKNVTSKRHLVMILRWFLQKKPQKILQGKVVYKCKREKCDYTETNIISVKEPGTDGKEDNKDNDKDNNPGNNEKPDVPADPNENG